MKILEGDWNKLEIKMIQRSPWEDKSEVWNANVVLSTVLLDVDLQCIGDDLDLDDFYDDFDSYSYDFYDGPPDPWRWLQTHLPDQGPGQAPSRKAGGCKLIIRDDDDDEDHDGE